MNQQTVWCAITMCLQLAAVVLLALLAFSLRKSERENLEYHGLICSVNRKAKRIETIVRELVRRVEVTEAEKRGDV